ncbi:MAG: AbrB/MazE/SpoVT family DNA-binding domain-containing protein [Schaedlerella sp.]|uniref:AbrB/MazE/SpoVT family DNA-binding domain-containing protein n=1 Tax=Schaedlerella sp. TaxID=2676057 RepID=UPI0035275781
MQDKKITQEYVLVSVPAELLVAAGIFAGDAIQMHVEGDRLIMESAENTGGITCSGDCENCPMGEHDCDGDCGSCPCSGKCDESGVA